MQVPYLHGICFFLQTSMITFLYAMIVALAAYYNYCKLINDCDINSIFNKTLRMIVFVCSLFLMCSLASLLEFKLNNTALVRIISEKILNIKYEYILGKGLFISICITVMTLIYKVVANKIKPKIIVDKDSIDPYGGPSRYWNIRRLLDLAGYTILIMATYAVASTVFIKLVVWAVKTYVKNSL